MATVLTKDDAIRIALADAESRYASRAVLSSVSDETYPNSSLGAARPGEMSADVLTQGWRIQVNAGGREFVYRAGTRQIRHIDADGNVHLVFPN